MPENLFFITSILSKIHIHTLYPYVIKTIWVDTKLTVSHPRVQNLYTSTVRSLASLSITRKYQGMLDKAAPHTMGRWIAWVVLLLIYFIRVFTAQGWYVYTQIEHVFKITKASLLVFSSFLRLSLSIRLSCSLIFMIIYIYIYIYVCVKWHRPNRTLYRFLCNRMIFFFFTYDRYIITYGLGIYMLNLFIGFLTPRFVDMFHELIRFFVLSIGFQPISSF